MLEKSRGLGVDCVAYDLEDSVAPQKKPDARRAIKTFLDHPRAQGIRENAVRINSVESGLALDDLSEVVCSEKADNLQACTLMTTSSKPKVWTQ